MAISVIVGLGNPGDQYKDTRHNVGFKVIEAFGSTHSAQWKDESRFQSSIAKIQINEQPLFLIKPQTYMNLSGVALLKFSQYYKIEPSEFMVIYDEVNINLGQIKLTVNGSAGGHNGIENILQNLGDGFTRFRIGIGPKYPPQLEISNYVLGKFLKPEVNIVNKKMKDFVDGLKLVIDSGSVLAMNQLNRKEINYDTDSRKEEI